MSNATNNENTILDTGNGIDDGTSLYGIATKEFTLHPNPATSQITVLSEGIKPVYIPDLNGRTILDIEDVQQQEFISLNNLQTGTYTLKAISENGDVKVRNFIKNQ